MNTDRWIILGMAIALIVLAGLLCNGKKSFEANSTTQQLDTLQSQENAVKEKTDSTDSALNEGVVKIDSVNAPIKERHREAMRREREYHAPDSNKSYQDTINFYRSALEDSDSIIVNQDSIRFFLEQRVANQKAFADSLQVMVSELQAIARKESKQVAGLTKMVQRRNFWLAVTSGAVAGLSLLVLVK